MAGLALISFSRGWLLLIVIACVGMKQHITKAQTLQLQLQLQLQLFNDTTRGVP